MNMIENKSNYKLSDYYAEVKALEDAKRSAHELKSTRIAAWVSAVAAIVATIAALIALFK